MKTKCYCGTDVLNRKGFCDDCLRQISAFCTRLNIDPVLFSFALENKDWLLRMAKECDSDWHGTLTLSIKQGALTHARWQYTELLQKKS